MKHSYQIFILTLSLTAIFAGCSVEKNTSFRRFYHNTTLKYNIYFNGKEAYKRGINRIMAANSDNFNEILPLFIDSKEENASSANAEMEKAIQKASKGIKIHSITKKPDMKKKNLSQKEREFFNQNEFNKWVDECYLLIGKAYFIKRDYVQARQNFEYIIRRFPNLDTRHIANLFLIRTFCEDKNFQAAKEAIETIEGEKKLPKKLNGDFAAIYADFYLKQKKYDDAIPKLNRAIKTTKKRKDRVRYNFVLAQIYEHKGDIGKASELYRYVAKKNTSYEMEFNAKINMAKCFVAKGGNTKDIYKTLKKMLRDDKNIEYKDQIYYAMAELDMKAKKTNEAIKHYKLSSESSVANDYQKAISCLKLGELYFEQLDYKNAQIYYDSCMAVLPATYENYETIKTNSRNLTELVQYTNVVEFEDSVQKLAKMSEGERNKIINDLIAAVVEQERLQREQEQMDMMNSMLFDERRGSTNANIATGGKWYFYNPSQLSYGKNEFTKKWGNRKNEDHWRRKNKAVVDFSGDNLAENADSTEGENARSRLTDNKTREYYLQDIPLTDSAMQASHQKITDALFNVGRIYKERFSDYNRAINAYEDLNQRYPQNEYLLLSYYNLYLLNKLVGNTAEADKYKNLVISKFGNTNYAKLLQNPNYMHDLEQKRQHDEQLYITAYDDYMAGKTASVVATANAFIAENQDNDLVPHFAFLQTLCVGRSADTIAFKTALAKFITDYSEHELADVAQNILGYFGTTDVNALIADLQSRPQIEHHEDTVQTTNVVTTESFMADEDQQHLYVIAVDADDATIKRISFEVRNFNIFNFSTKTFNVVNVPCNDKMLISVRMFKNKRQASNYMRLIANSDDVFGRLQKINYKIFVISIENFAILQQNKNLNEYLNFYEQHYK